MGDEVCQCGFGDEYFTIEDGNSICTVCGGVIAAPKSGAAGSGEEVRRKKILIVDDQPFFRKRIRDILVEEGNDLLEAGEGLEAVSLFAEILRGSAGPGKSRLDLVILDLTMPGLIDGFQTLGVLKAMEESLPIVILTSNPPTPDLLQKLGRLKAKKYLNKASKDLEALLLKNIANL